MKVFAIHISDKGLVLEYMKSSYNSMIKRQPIKKLGKKTYLLYKERYLNGQKCMIKYSTPLVIKEMQMKITKYHFMPFSIAVTKKIENKLVRSWRHWNSCTLLLGM